MNALHGDPQQPVALLGAKRVDMRGVGVVEQARELGLAHEALHGGVASAEPAVQDLDHRLSPKPWLVGAVHGPVPALADRLAQDVLTNL
jgi:hypothetical protein